MPVSDPSYEQIHRWLAWAEVEDFETKYKLLDSIRWDIDVYQSSDHPILHDLLTCLVGHMRHRTLAIRILAIECITQMIPGRVFNSRMGMIVAVACECFESVKARSSEDLRQNTITLMQLCFRYAKDEVEKVKELFTDDVIRVISNGLVDECIPVRASCCAILGTLVSKIPEKIDSSIANELRRMIILCCKSNIRQLRESAVNCLTDFAVAYPHIVLSNISTTLMESLTVDAAPQVRIALASFFCASGQTPESDFTYFAVALSFDDDKAVVAEALKLFRIDSPQSDEVLVQAISDHLNHSAFAQEIIKKFSHTVENPGSDISGVARLVALKTLPVVANLLSENDPALRGVLDMMIGEHGEESVKLACKFVPIKGFIGCLYRCASDPSQTITESVFINTLEILHHIFLHRQDVSEEMIDQICFWLERFFVDSCLTYPVAGKIISLCDILSRFSEPTRSPIARVRIYAEAVLTPDDADEREAETMAHKLRQESYVRELGHIIESVESGQCITAKDRKILIHILRRIETISDERICPIVHVLVRCRNNSQARMDGLEMVHLLARKGMVSREIIGSIFEIMNAEYGVDRNFRKLSLFVMLALVKSVFFVLNKEMIGCIRECSTSDDSPDCRFLALKIFDQCSFERIDGTELLHIVVEALLVRLNDDHEQVRNLALEIISKLDMSRLSSETKANILSALRLHALVSLLAQECLNKLE